MYGSLNIELLCLVDSSIDSILDYIVTKYNPIVLITFKRSSVLSEITHSKQVFSHELVYSIWLTEEAAQGMA